MCTTAQAILRADVLKSSYRQQRWDIRRAVYLDDVLKVCVRMFAAVCLRWPKP